MSFRLIPTFLNFQESVKKKSEFYVCQRTLFLNLAYSIRPNL